MSEPIIKSQLMTMGDALLDVAAQYPDEDAVVMGEHSLTYRQFVEKVDTCARALVARGVQAGDRVAILSPPRPEVLVVALAAARLGATYLGLGTRLMRQDLDFVLGDATPTVVFSVDRDGDRSYAGDVSEACLRAGIEHCVIFAPTRNGDISGEFARFLAEASAEPGPVPGSIANPADAFAIIYTSGTTGKPKGVVITHAAIMASTRSITERMNLTRIRSLSVLPVDHIAFLVSDVVRVILTGGAAILLPRFDPTAVLQAIVRYRPTVWCAIPAMLQRVAACDEFTELDLTSLRLVWWPGLIPDRTFERVRSIWPNLGVSYGMSESAGAISFARPNMPDEALKSTAGPPLDGLEVRLVPPADARDEDPGEVQIRGPQVLTSYWNRPDATTDAFTADGWFKTGDLARFVGENLQIVGRQKELIRSGGYNISPNEIEAALLKHPAVDGTVVFGLPDELYGETVQAAWTAAPGGEASDDELRAFLRDVLSGFKVPKTFWLLPTFPMLANGKVDRRAVRARIGQRRATSESPS
jgi:acyl-CoA synthetase (AMP-forming)/AMP-acid ligase II